MSDDRWTEMDELMLRRTTLGLSDAELERLTELLESAPDEDREWIDRLVGELDAGLAARTDDALPEALRQNLLDRAEEARAATASGITTGGAVRERSTPALPASGDPTGGVTPIRRPNAFAWLGWAAAAVLAGLLLVPAPDSAPPTVEPVAVEPTAMERALAAADRPDAVRLPWTATDDPTASAGVGGEVVWSDAAQAGYMRFTGLASNDPDEFQYQLWIFDAERDDRFPVDGGVFDIDPETGEVIVPIDARLPVDRAVLFAVTVEAPGGVVVSDRSRIAVLAQAE